MRPDYRNDFLAFRRDMCPVEGAWGPTPIIPDWLETWYRLTFPNGLPATRNVLDARSKKEGKSSDAAAVALFMATREPWSEVVIVAADKDQAKDRVLRACKFAVEHGPLSKHAKVYRDSIEFDNRSTITAFPADWKGASGGNYACIILDELHTYTLESQRRLFEEMLIPPSQPNGVRWICSYAGFEQESLLLREWWDAGMIGEPLSTDPPVYHNHEWGLLALIDTGPASWRMPWVTADFIEEVKASERENTFRRLWLNKWVSAEGEFVEREQWDACFSRNIIPLRLGDGRKVILGIDASTTRDITGAVGCWKDVDRGVVQVLFVRFWKPRVTNLRGGKPTIDLSQVDAVVRGLHEGGNLDCVVCDPYQLHSLLVGWERAGIKVEEMPQTSARAEADQALYDAIAGRTLEHFGHADLAEHVLNAVAVESARGLRLDKMRASKKIDLAVALSMAHKVASERRKPVRAKVMMLDTSILTRPGDIVLDIPRNVRNWD